MFHNSTDKLKLFMNTEVIASILEISSFSFNKLYNKISQRDMFLSLENINGKV